MTLRDLIEGITEIQGEVVVRQFSHDADDIIGENPLGEIRSDSSAWSNEILYMYADFGDIRNRADAPILFIEVEAD